MIFRKRGNGYILTFESFSACLQKKAAFIWLRCGVVNVPQVPLTFEESFIAFKVGLGYIVEMRNQLPGAEPFFSRPLTSRSILSLLEAFSQENQDFSVLLLHLPPPEKATVLISNTRAALQDCTWNAFISMWSFQEVFGRLEVSQQTCFSSCFPQQDGLMLLCMPLFRFQRDRLSDARNAAPQLDVYCDPLRKTR